MVLSRVLRIYYDIDDYVRSLRGIFLPTRIRFISDENIFKIESKGVIF